MTNDLITLLEERLPKWSSHNEQRDELRRISSDTSALNDTFEEFVKDRSYSSSHKFGPIEVSIDSEKLEEAIDKVADFYKKTNRELQNSIDKGNGTLGEINKRQGAILSTAQNMHSAFNRGNVLLEAIYEQEGGMLSVGRNISISVNKGNEILEEVNEQQGEILSTSMDMASSLKTANIIDASNLVTNILGLGIAKRSLEELESINEGIDFVGDELVEVNENLEGINSELVEVNENLEDIASNQKRTIKIQKKTNQWLEKVHNKIGKLEYSVVECFAGISGQQDKIILQNESIHKTLLSLCEGQEKMRKEIVDTINSLSKNSFSIHADEKYSFAYEQYRAGRYSTAINDLKAALKEKSTHLPSLLLLGTISARYTKWTNAKDTFYHAAQLAKFSKEIKTYHSAMINLANIESLVGNLKEAKKVLDEAVETAYSPELDEAYLKMIAMRIK